ncbi:hypothetical protein EW146_g8733 [Bondarzewia mesenterica]|uniref:Histone H1 n=1 Tax=Bondarzewia mesenterica TaxID=1095465 RepID=A0A4S4LC54_9AGAM|nr:hypothetical protein EW146_g8733 [Bondarzewia mesenterica]
MSESPSPLASPVPEQMSETETKATRPSRSSRKSTEKKEKEPKEKKSKSKVTAKKPIMKKKADKAASPEHPSWKDIIKECIADHHEDARSGASRSTIKKYAEEKYNLEMNAGNLFQLNRAITSGAEKGTFILPKGPSGKVKLSPKRPRAAVETKELEKKTVDEPVKKVKVPKKASKSKEAAPVAEKKTSKRTKAAPVVAPAKKTMTTAKKAAASKKAADKTKKTSSAKSSEKKVAAAKAAATKSAKTKTKAATAKATKTRTSKKAEA